MGLPELTFTMRKAAETTAARAQAGTVGLILRDTKALGTHTIRRESDIPSDLSPANTAAVKRAMVGHINRPGVVYLSVLGADDDIDAGFSALSGVSYDYLAGPADLTAQEAAGLAALVKEQRKLRYIGKAVLPNLAADNEGVINFTASGIKAGSETFTAAAYAGRIAGLLAGTPSDGSASYAALPELTGVDAVEGADNAVDAGKLFLINDGRKIKLSRAVTSKTTLASGEGELLKKIKMVAAVDLIRYYAISTVEDEYLGKCSNSYDNKCVLITAMRDYLSTLEARGVLAAGKSGAELDAQAIRNWLLARSGTTEEAERIRALDDAALRREDTGSHVFLLLWGRVLDAMEDFHIVLETA